MDAQKNIKLADFGLSNYLEDGDFLRTSCGSPNYAAPEVISGKLYAGPEIDIWSCGVTLYVMLCGQLPFDDEHIPTLFKKINSGVFRLPSYLSNHVKDLLTSMLAVDPLKRITIAEIRKSPWFAKDLPDYLKEPSLPSDSVFYSKINDEIVQELSKKMKFSTKTIYHALTERDNNQIKVGYQLYLDNLAPLKPNYPSVDPIITVLKNANLSDIPNQSSSIQIISNSIPTPAKQEIVDPRKARTTRSRWHYGIRSRSDPMEIMKEIYNALGRTQLKWKSITPFRIRCIHESIRGEKVKFEIQLYKIESGNYLVDFKKVSNTQKIDDPNSKVCIFTFFDACVKLITELAVSA